MNENSLSLSSIKMDTKRQLEGPCIAIERYQPAQQDHAKVIVSTFLCSFIISKAPIKVE